MWYEEEKSFSPHLIWTVTVTQKKKKNKTKKSSIIFCSAYFNITKQTEKYIYINKITFLTLLAGPQLSEFTDITDTSYTERQGLCRSSITLLKSKYLLLILKLLQQLQCFEGLLLTGAGMFLKP